MGDSFKETSHQSGRPAGANTEVWGFAMHERMDKLSATAMPAAAAIISGRGSRGISEKSVSKPKSSAPAPGADVPLRKRPANGSVTAKPKSGKSAVAGQRQGMSLTRMFTREAREIFLYDYEPKHFRVAFGLRSRRR